MKIFKRLLAGLLFIAVIGVGGFGLFAPGPLVRDPPRDLPWVLPDYRNAHAQWEVGHDGRIYANIEHLFLAGISPAMVAWFYQQLPVSTIELKGTRYPLYHIFHPVGHGRISVVEAAPNGLPGMAQGAMVAREEWFGPYDSRGSARLVEFSDDGMLAVPIVGGLSFGQVRHSYRAENGGTFYKTQAVIGSDLPLVGPVLNWFIRTRLFPPAMMALWQQHQIEEVASLQFFLAEIYAQRGGENHYVLAGAPFE